jgi:hypothetical protein
VGEDKLLHVWDGGEPTAMHTPWDSSQEEHGGAAWRGPFALCLFLF